MTDRFDIKIDELLANRVPDTTVRVNNWALNKFNSWLQSSTLSAEFSDFDQIPVQRLNYILELFLVAVGFDMRMKTTYSVITALNRRLRETRDEDLDLFSTKRFAHFRNVFDGYCKTKQAEEDTSVKKSDIISETDEQLLWKTAFGVETGKKLLVTLIYLITKTFAIRGGDELYQIRNDSLTLETSGNSHRITYMERRSKNKQPGLANINKQKKRVTHYDPVGKTNTLAYILLLYLRYSHPEVTEKNSTIPLFNHPHKTPVILAGHPIW